MIQDSEWKLFFNQLLIDMVFLDGAYEFYKKANINPRHWPSCTAKDLALKLEAAAAKKGIDSAKLLVFEAVKKLPGCDIPHKSFQVLGYYERFKTVGIAFEMSERLKVAPLELESIVANFKKNSIASIDTFDLAETVKQAILRQEQYIRSGKSVVQIPDWPILSNLIGGFNPGRIFLVTAETGIGKTTLALNLTTSMLKKAPVLYFNMEMIPDDIAIRMMQIGANVSAKEWRSGEYIHKLSDIAEWIEKVSSSNKLVMTVGKALALEEMVSKIIQEKETNEIKLVIVDYDQKIRTNNHGEEWQILQKAVEEFEEVAKLCEIPIVILAQAKEASKGATAGDPKASARTKQSASAVIRLHKDDEEKYYVEILKNRFGPRGKKISLHFDFETMKMLEEKEIETNFHQKPVEMKGMFK